MSDRNLMLLFPAGGVLLTLLLSLEYVRERAFRRRAKAAPGVVVGIKASTGVNTAPTFAPIVTYRLPDGREFTARHPKPSAPQRHHSGQQVTVLYDPDNPESVRVEGMPKGGVLWIFGSLLALTIGAIGFAVWLLTG